MSNRDFTSITVFSPERKKRMRKRRYKQNREFQKRYDSLCGPVTVKRLETDSNPLITSEVP